MSFGDWLKRQRIDRGWTQKELALQVNCSVSTIRKMEAEERRPSFQVVNHLADLFAIPETERKLFLRFARGDWQSIPGAAPQETTPDGLSPSQSSNLPNSMMRLISMVNTGEATQFTWETPYVKEKLGLIQRALEQAETTGDIRRQMECLWQLGWLNQEKRFRFWERALALARVLGDAQALAGGLSTAGFFLVLNGNIKAANKYLSESASLYQQMQMKPVISHLLSAYGQISMIRGNFEEAREYLLEHARASLEAGSREDYLWSNVRLGYVALRERNLEDARRIFEKCAREFNKDKNFIGIIFTLEGMANLSLEEDDPTRASTLLGWADSTRQKISDIRPVLEQADINAILTASSRRLGKMKFSKAYMKGQKMALGEAVQYALRENKSSGKKR